MNGKNKGQIVTLFIIVGIVILCVICGYFLVKTSEESSKKAQSNAVIECRSLLGFAYTPSPTKHSSCKEYGTNKYTGCLVWNLVTDTNYVTFKSCMGNKGYPNWENQ